MKAIKKIALFVSGEGTGSNRTFSRYLSIQSVHKQYFSLWDVVTKFAGPELLRQNHL